MLSLEPASESLEDSKPATFYSFVSDLWASVGAACTTIVTVYYLDYTLVCGYVDIVAKKLSLNNTVLQKWIVVCVFFLVMVVGLLLGLVRLYRWWCPPHKRISPLVATIHWRNVAPMSVQQSKTLQIGSKWDEVDLHVEADEHRHISRKHCIISFHSETKVKPSHFTVCNWRSREGTFLRKGKSDGSDKELDLCDCVLGPGDIIWLGDPATDPPSFEVKSTTYRS